MEVMEYIEAALDYLRKGMKCIYTDELPMPCFAELNAVYIRRGENGREHMYIALGNEAWYDVGALDTPYANTETKMHPQNCKNCGAPLHGRECK